MLNFIKHVFISISIIVSSAFPGYSSSQPSQTVNVTPTPIVNKFITATAKVTQDNTTVNISVRLPIEGGPVTGSFDGFCEGAVTGTYDGAQNGKVSGKLDGTCGYFVLKTSATATFTGTVDKKKGQIPIEYEAHAGSSTRSGSTDLHFQPVE